MGRALTFTFTNSDLDLEFKHTFSHSGGTANVIFAWYDENNVDRSTTDIFTDVTSTEFTINVGGPITGTHRIVMFYDDTLQIIGRRLHELTLIDDVPSGYRIAVGKPGNETFNVLFDEIINDAAEQLTGSTIFLKTNNNLGEIAAAGTSAQASARTNLSVYSKNDIKTKIDALTNTYSFTLDLTDKDSGVTYTPVRTVYANRWVHMHFRFGCDSAYTAINRIGRITQVELRPPSDLYFPCVIQNLDVGNEGGYIKVGSDGYVYASVGKKDQTYYATVSYPFASNNYLPEFTL